MKIPRAKIKTIGEVAVDSGQICVIDPCRSGEDPQLKGMVIGTNYGDGLYTVEEVWVHREREGLFISLQGLYADVLKKKKKKKTKKK